MPHLQRWVNNKQFDGGQSSEEEKLLRDFYKRLLSFSIKSEALMGAYQDIHVFNRQRTENYNHKLLSFVRWNDSEKLIVVSNFDSENNYDFELEIPEEVITKWNIRNGTYKLVDQLYGLFESSLKVEENVGKVTIKLAPLQSYILKIE